MDGIEGRTRQERTKRETMCIQNIGSAANNGDPIPKGKPYRMVNAVLNNNPMATALTDDEIEELSKHNEDAVGPGRAEYDTYYRIEFVGKFSLDNICYAIMRPCRCVKSHINDTIILKTARFCAMNTITRLITRLEGDTIEKVTVFRMGEGGQEQVIGVFDNAEPIISFIQEDKLKKHPVIGSADAAAGTITLKSADNRNTVETVDLSMELMEENSRLKEKIMQQEQENAMLKAEVEELRRKLDGLRELLQ